MSSYSVDPKDGSFVADVAVASTEESCCRGKNGCKRQKTFASSAEERSSCSGEEDACCDGNEETPRLSPLSCGSRNGGACCEGEEVNGPGEVLDSKEVDAKEVFDDDFTCMCCIDVLVNEPTLQATTDRRPVSNSLGPSSLTDITASYLGTYTNNLRTCCQALVQYCVRRSCCFVSPIGKQTLSSPSLVYSADVPTDKATTVPRKEDAFCPGEKLQLEIRGMDCVDCVPKLQYDPETISPTAIAAYVARATGFSVKALTAPTYATAGLTIALPIAFSIIPPHEAFDGFSTRPGPNSRTIEVLFPVHVDSPLRPREVLEQFKAYGAELVPPGSDIRNGIATRDLLLVGARTIACALLSIPVLVFAWADLPRRPILYGGISVGLTTLIQALAFPIFSAAVRALLYLRQLDLNVLVSGNVYAAHTPEEKDAVIAALQAKGKRVCFIGDGTNDGPALSRADISLAMAAGSEVPLTAAGGVLLGSDLRRGVLAFMDIANAVRMHAQLALGWCVLYNVFAILLASGAFVKVRIEPRWAGIGEVVSVVPLSPLLFGLMFVGCGGVYA